MMGQIEFADVIVLNKSDLVTKKQAKSIKAAIQTLNPAAEVVMATRGNVPLETVLCTGILDLGFVDWTGFLMTTNYQSGCDGLHSSLSSRRLAHLCFGGVWDVGSTKPSRPVLVGEGRDLCRVVADDARRARPAGDRDLQDLKLRV